MLVGYAYGKDIPWWLYGLLGIYVAGFVICAALDRKRILSKYVEWRYGVSGTYRLKPPLGFPPCYKPSWWQRFAFGVRRAIWRAESRVYVGNGKES